MGVLRDPETTSGGYPSHALEGCPFVVCLEQLCLSNLNCRKDKMAQLGLQTAVAEEERHILAHRHELGSMGVGHLGRRMLRLLWTAS